MSSELLRLLEVMDRLRSPGGCPWDAEQTHQSLLKYLLEESYEFVDSVDQDDREAMREELGDILLQVYFHSRIAQDHPTDPFDIEEVAKGISDKLIRRHPHVFGDVKINSDEELLQNWERIKAEEKGRKSATDGVALSQPALSLITKLIYRAEKNGIDLNLPTPLLNNEVPTDVAIGDALVAAVVAAIKEGIEPEDLLRSRAREISDEIKRLEAL
jgi:XTP/dITP diphosphohydrolase